MADVQAACHSHASDNAPYAEQTKQNRGSARVLPVAEAVASCRRPSHRCNGRLLVGDMTSMEVHCSKQYDQDEGRLLL